MLYTYIREYVTDVERCWPEYDEVLYHAIGLELRQEEKINK